MKGQMIGFDFGERTLKMAVVSDQTCKQAVCIEVPDNLVSNGKILSVDAMADFIKEAAKEYGIPKGDAAVILPGEEVIVRNVTMSAMSHQQMRYNLPYEFRDYLTEDKEKYTFDYAVYGMALEDSPVPQMRLLTCCVLTSVVDRYRTLLRKAGFKLKIALPAEVAYRNLVQRYLGADGRGDFCIVDLGHAETRIQIFHNDEHGMRNTLTRGGRALDELIADKHGVDIHMARTYKANNYNNVLSDPSCREFYHELAVDVMKAVHFFNYNNREAKLEAVYLCGGGSEIEELRDEIADMTNATIYSGSRLLPEGTDVDTPWQYLQAIGCAMNEV